MPEKNLRGDDPIDPPIEGQWLGINYSTNTFSYYNDYPIIEPGCVAWNGRGPTPSGVICERGAGFLRGTYGYGVGLGGARRGFGYERGLGYVRPFDYGRGIEVGYKPRAPLSYIGPYTGRNYIVPN